MITATRTPEFARVGSLFKPKIETTAPPLPPAANPPTFASVYSSIAGQAGQKKLKKASKDAGFGDTDGSAPGGQPLAKPITTATPSLLG